MGVEGRTPGYMVREEWQREKLRSRAGRRAWGFEERLREGGGSSWARMSAGNEGKDDEEGELSEWEMERQKFFEERGVEVREWERDRDEGGVNWEKRGRTEGRRRQREER